MRDSIWEEIPSDTKAEVLQGYKHYIEKGWADMDDRRNMENIYTQYHALKGNGDMNDLRRTFRHLPMTKGGVPTEVTD